MNLMLVTSRRFKTSLVKIGGILLLIAFPLLLIGPLDIFRPMLPDFRIIAIVVLVFTLGCGLLAQHKALLVFKRSTGTTIIALLLFTVSSLTSSFIYPPLDSVEDAILLPMCFVAFLAIFLIITQHSNKQDISEKMTRVVSLSSLAISIVSVSIFIAQDWTIPVLQKLITQKAFIKEVFELNRDRIHPLGPIDMVWFFPAALVVATKGSNKKFWYSVLSVGLLSLLLGNYRSRIISGLFGIVAFILIIGWRKLNMGLLLIILSLSVSLSLLLPTSPIDRFFLPSTVDKLTISTRIENVKKAFEVFKTSPFFGVGPGNLKNYVELESFNTSSRGTGILTYEAYQHPHNLYVLLLSETGLVGFIFFTFFLLSSFSQDYMMVSNSRTHHLDVVIAVSSWVFLFGSIMDWYSANSIIIFFMFRGYLLAISTSPRSK